MNDADATSRAYTLLSSAPDATVEALDAWHSCVAAVAWRHSLLLLLRTAPRMPLAGTWSHCQARLEATHWLAHPDGPQAQGAVVVDGRLLRVSPAGRRNAAFHLWRLHPREELLAAVEGDGFTLAYLIVTGAFWDEPGRQVPLTPAELVTTERDEVLAGSLGACDHLNSHHRDLASSLAGRPAHFTEVDATGTTLMVDGSDEEYVRVRWPAPCGTLADVFTRLRGVCPASVAPSVR